MSRIADDRIGADTVVGLVSQGSESRRGTYGLLAGLAGVAGVCLMVALLKPVIVPASLAKRASGIVVLPADAHILSVKDGDAREHGDVWFTVPEPKGPGTRQDEIWGLNGNAAVSGTPFVRPVRGTPVVRHPSKGKPAMSPALAPSSPAKVPSARPRPAKLASPKGPGVVVASPAIVVKTIRPWVTERVGQSLRTGRFGGDQIILSFDPISHRYHYLHHVDYAAIDAD